MDPLTPFPLEESAGFAARAFIGVTSPLLALAALTLGVRIGFKLRSGVKFWWDDYLIIFGFALAAADWVVLLEGCRFYASSSKKFTNMKEIYRGVMYGLIGIPIWGWACMFIKLSVLSLYLKLTQDRNLRRFLWSFLILLTIIYTASNIFACLICNPLAATWNPAAHPGAKCVGPNVVPTVSYIVAGFSVATDIVLSLFPLTFLLKLRRPRLERTLISMLMGIGLAASGVSIAKAVYVTKWAKETHSAYIGITLSMLSTTEMLIGSIAACLPCLKSTVQGLLEKSGLSFRSDLTATPAFTAQRISLQRHGLVPESSEEALRDKGMMMGRRDVERGSTRHDTRRTMGRSWEELT